MHKYRFELSVVTTLLAASPSFAQCLPSFGPPITIPINAPHALALVDVNGDTKKDLVCTSGTSTITTCLNLGNGSFGPPISSQMSISNISALAVADFNLDGKPDVVSVSPVGVAGISLGTGTGTFTAQFSFPTNQSNLCIAIADLDHDGIPDLIFDSFTSSLYVVYRGLGTGNFSFVYGAHSGWIGPIAMIPLDYNYDGDTDMVFCNQTPGKLDCLQGLGNGQLGGSSRTFTLNITPAGIAAGDFNADGRQDLVSPSLDSSTFVVLNGDGTAFAAPQSYTGMSNMHGVATGDFNIDGRSDLVFSFNNDQLAVMMSTATGFGQPITLTTAANPQIPVVADLNSDGYPDIAVPCASGSVQVFFNSINLPPQISTQPVSARAQTGQAVQFNVASPAPNATYQWRRNGVNLTEAPPYSGVATPTLTVTPNVADDLATFDAIVSNGCLSATSSPAALYVAPCPGDFNRDGSVDFFDYLDFVDAFSIGC